MGYETDFDPSTTLNLVSVAAVAGTTSTFTSTVTSNTVIRGLFVTTQLTAQTNAATPTTDWSTKLPFIPLTPNQCCAIVFGVDHLGTLRMSQGRPIACGIGVTTTVGSFLQAPQFPDLDNDFCPLAYTIVRTAPSAATWTPGAGSWTASGVSATTFQNVAMLPDRPQIA
jgi:hypothetical protein